MKKLLNFLLLLPVLAMAAEIDFTKGRPKNFTTQLLKDPEYTADKGLSGSSSGRLIATKLSLNASDIPMIEVFTGGEKLKIAKLYFDIDGKNFTENNMFRGRILNNKVVFETANNPRWQGKIGALRIDLAPVSGGISVKKIVITQIQPGIPAAVNFTDGSMRGWQITFAPKGTAATAGRGIAFETTGKERLLSAPVKLDCDKCDVIELTMTGEYSSVKLFFTSGNEPFSESKMVRGKRKGDVVKFDFSANKLWNGQVNKLRLDIFSPVGTPVEIKNIEFLKGEGPNALTSPWRKPAQIAPGKEISGSSEVLSPLPVNVTYQTSGKVEINVDYLDIYGGKLQSAALTADPGKKAWTLGFVPRTAQLKFNIRNLEQNNVSFQMKLMMIPQENKIEQMEYSVKLSDVPVNSTEYLTWTPQITFSPAIPAGKRFTLCLKSDSGASIVAADTVLETETATLATDKLHLRYLKPGKYTVVAAIDDVPCKMPEYVINHTRESKISLPQVTIDRSGSRPYYIINGKEKVNTMEYLGSDPPLSRFAYRQIFNAIDNGINGIRLRVIFRFDENNKLDFKEVDEALQTILMRRPDTNIMFHVSVTDPGPKWRAAHPEEGIRNIKGEFHVLNYQKKPEATSSMASRRWVEDSVTMLTALTEHLKNVPGGERVIGILPCSGITWEWLHWGSAQGEWVDYSEHYRQFFISYLRKIYSNDIAKLNRAWQSKYSCFEDIQIPLPARRQAADHVEFRTPAEFQPEIDLSDSLSYLVSDVIITLCKGVKKASDGKLLTGTYYGYTIYLNGARRAQETGHFALSRILQVPEIDIVMAPSRYAGRNIGGAAGFMYPEGSLNLHGKLNISECDDRPINASSATGRADTVAGSRAALERAYGLQNSAFSVMRWFDFSKGWVMAEPRMLDVVRKLSKFDKSVGKSAIPAMPAAATAAVFTAERSAAVLKPDSRLQALLLQNGYETLAASGMSFSFFNINDIVQAEKERKLLLFINCFRLTGEEADMLKKSVAAPGRVYFFTSGVGLFRDGKLDTSFMKEIFGCDFEHSPARAVRESFTTAEAEKLLGIPAGKRLRTDFECGDIFYVSGKNVIPLAKTADGKIALGAIKKNGSLFIYCAHPVVSAELFRAVAKKAGLPVIHAEKAAVWYNGGFGTVHTARPVTATVELPAGFKGITQFPDMKFIPAKNGKVVKQLTAESTWIFYIVK